MSNENENDLTHNNLLYFALLLMLSSFTLPNSYSDNNGGRKSFMLSKKFYNSITNNQNIDINFLILYSDDGSYNTLNDNLNKTVLSTNNFDNELDSIEEKYMKTKSKKHSRIDQSSPSSSKLSKNDTQSINKFLEAISQIKLGTSTIQKTDKDVTKLISKMKI
ncbi:32259_t:CDS:2 [Racocetra persica]|uniref:32259_t:CDS:1 n=1 Tax=Racocetra persica TaxID=160502 RepID=A0ACA9LT17_9GLOM|nr:32259_t:CDS:2 [Racocetra persica]